MKHNDWTDKLRNRLADREAPVPDDLWSRIEARMDEAGLPPCAGTDAPGAKEAAPPQASAAAPRRRMVRMALWAASAAAVVAVLTVMALYVSDGSIRQVAVVERQAARHNYRVVWPTDSGCLLVAKAAAADAEAPLVHSAAPDGVSCQAVPPASEEPGTDDGADKQEPQCGESVAESAAVAGGPKTAAEKKPYAAPARPTCYANEPAAVTRRRGQWHVALHADGVAIGSQNRQHPMVMVGGGGMSFASEPGGVAAPGNLGPMYLKASSPLTAEYSEKKHHARPVSVGVTVDVPLTRRVSIVTGAVYTSAATDFVSSAGKSEMVEKQRLHYVGVPLALKVGVWSTGCLHTYASAGGQADFNVAAQLKAADMVKDIKKDRPQFSLGAAVGVQYDVVDRLGLYAEPGMKYYIDNGSGMETIFKDKKLNFSLQLGLRYGF